MSKQVKHSLAVREQIEKVTGQVLQNYLQIDPDKRHELEEQGVNMSSMFTEALTQFTEQARIGTILVVMEEGIGNMVMLTPALRTLRASHPSLKVTVLCKDPAAQVIRGWEVVDKVITEFDNEYYDLVYFTIWSNNSKQHLGETLMHYCKSSIAADFRVFHEAIQHGTICDFMESFGELAPAHCQIADGEEAAEVLGLMKTAKIYIPPTEELGAEQVHTIKKYIIFGDTALRLPGGGWDKKRWPYYTELAELIQRKFPEYKIIVVGDEEDYAEQKEKVWPSNVTLDFMGKLSIPQLALLMKDAEFYIGNDTGPTHMAAAVGTKTYAIFGPTLPGKNMPLGEDVTMLNKRLPCSPCQYTDKFDNCECINYFTADDVYNRIFFPNKGERKRVMVVGDFGSGGQLGTFRNENYIRKTLDKHFGFKVVTFDIRNAVTKHKGNSINATYDLVNEIMFQDPEFVLVCGGQTVHPSAFYALNMLKPKLKTALWYVDNRGQVEQWFKTLSSVFTTPFWSTGQPDMLSQVFGKTQNPCRFLPIVPSDSNFLPLDNVEKDIDVLFVGSPHSEARIKMLETVVENLPGGATMAIYGNGEWPTSLKKYAKPGVFDKDFNKVLNRAKLVVNQNIINNIPLYFSDRYFYPMAAGTVGLNFHIPDLEDMMTDGKHCVFWNTPEELSLKIEGLLKDDNKRKYIAEQGHKLFKSKYTLKHILGRMLDIVGVDYVEKTDTNKEKK